MEENYTVPVQISRTRSWAGGGQHEQDAVLQDLQEDQRRTVHMGRKMVKTTTIRMAIVLYTEL